MSETSERLLDVAQELVQQRGFNAFSFRDLAKRLEITNAGIHYHFPTKAALGQARVRRYSQNFMRALSRVDMQANNSVDQLKGLSGIYKDALKAGRFCLCGMMASDSLTLPSEVLGEVQNFFDAVEQWVSRVLVEGKDEGVLAFDTSPEEEAKFFLAAIEGAMLTAWPILSVDKEKALAQFEALANRLSQTYLA